MRVLVSFLLCCAVLGIGASAAFVQADNFDRAAHLDAQQKEVEWFERRMTGFEESLERFEFEQTARDDAAVLETAMRGVR